MSDSSCHASVSPSLSLELVIALTCCSGRNVSAPPGLRAAETVRCTLTFPLLKPLLGPWELWEGEGRWLLESGFVFCLVMAAARPQLTHHCVLSLPLSLGSAAECTGQWGKNADSTTLLFKAAECVPCKLTPPLLLSLLGLHWVLGCNCGTGICSSPFPPPIFTQIHPLSDVSMQESQTYLCVEQKILCWITAVRLIVTSKGEIWRTYHAATMLISLSTF